MRNVSSVTPCPTSTHWPHASFAVRSIVRCVAVGRRVDRNGHTPRDAPVPEDAPAVVSGRPRTSPSADIECADHRPIPSLCEHPVAASTSAAPQSHRSPAVCTATSITQPDRSACGGHRSRSLTCQILLTYSRRMGSAGAPVVADVFGVLAHPVRRELVTVPRPW